MNLYRSTLFLRYRHSGSKIFNRCKCTRSPQRKMPIFSKNRSRKDHNHFFLALFYHLFSVDLPYRQPFATIIYNLSLSNLILLPTTIHPKKQNYSNNSFFFSSFSSPFLYRSSFDYMEVMDYILVSSYLFPSIGRRFTIGVGEGGGKKRRRVWQMELVENGGGDSSSCCIGLVKGGNKHGNIGGCIV